MLKRENQSIAYDYSTRSWVIDRKQCRGLFFCFSETYHRSAYIF